MTYQPRNRRIALKEAMIVDGVTFYVDDVQSDGEPVAWGREGSPVRVVTHHTGRFTLCDDRGRFLKRATAQRGEGRRRTQTFATKLDAATAQVRRGIESCE